MPEPLMIQGVSKVERAVEPLQEASPKEAVEQLVDGPVEACSEYCGSVVSCRFHPFISAIHAAFRDHRPLVLSPDMFWLLVAQGFAHHVNENAEEYRSQFVDHEGKKMLKVVRDDFVKGSLENPWDDVFDEFSQQIREHIGEGNHSNIVVNFTTTGAIEKAANEIVLMDSMKNYFEYIVDTRCGIPQVTLEGKKEDWMTLRDRTEALGREYSLVWWTDRLLPTLDLIVKNAAGADEPRLWENIYKWQSVSGGDSISGWITDFFPYLQDWQGNSRLNWTLGVDSGSARRWARTIGTSNLPGSLSKSPFIWKYLGTKFSMEFIAGFTSFTQNVEDMSVRPKIGWAVREVKEQNDGCP